MLSACGPQAQKESESTVTEKSNSDAVIETIMSRRSIRKYKPEAVNRDTMKIILDCGFFVFFGLFVASMPPTDRTNSPGQYA